MKKTEENKVESSAEFTLENIEKGLFSTRKIGMKTDWQMFASLRLLVESGQYIDEKAYDILREQKFKWYYYKRISDENNGNIIIGLHKKDIPTWIYIVFNVNDGTKTEFKNLKDAKNSFSTNEATE